MTTTDYAVLGLLSFGERSGYDLAAAAGRSTGYMWAPSRSQIYKVLPRLVERGLARRRRIEQRARPDKELYRITPAGRAALRAWIEEVDEDPADGTVVFLLKVFFAWNAPAAAALAQLDAYRKALSRTLREFERIAASLPDDEPPHSLAALRHGIARARATLRWIDETREALSGSARASRP